MTPATCLALATSLLPPAMAPNTTPAPTCVQLGAEVAGRFSMLTPIGGIDRSFALTRSRFGAGIDLNGAGARMVFTGVRSGGDNGYIGVNGESIVPQVQVAEARYHTERLGLTFGMGLVDDPWVVTSNQAWDLRAVAPGLGEGQGWLERSDLGGTLAWTAPASWATVAVLSTSGEGLSRRERNNGQDTSGILIIRPLSSVAAPESLELQLYGRDGSRGLGRARDHRFGARLTHRSLWTAGGIEVLRAWGVGGDALRAPLGISVFGQLTPPPLPALVFARYDHIDEDLRFQQTERNILRFGLGLELPPDHQQPPMRLLLGWDHTRQDPGATSIAGSLAQQRSSAFYVQLDFRGVASIAPHASSSTL